MQNPALDLHAIVYASASTKRMTEALLSEARELNRQSSLTGVLLCSDGQFMQYLEGYASNVRMTYDRISSSRSHTRITEMMNGPIAAREFPAWDMAFAQATSSELVTLSTASWVTQETISVARARASMGMKLLRDFWRRQSKWRQARP